MAARSVTLTTWADISHPPPTLFLTTDLAQFGVERLSLEALLLGKEQGVGRVCRLLLLQLPCLELLRPGQLRLFETHMEVQKARQADR